MSEKQHSHTFPNMMLIAHQFLAINESNWFRWSLHTFVLSQGVSRLPQQGHRKPLHRLANGDPNSGNMSERQKN